MDDDLKKLIEDAASETRRHFDVVAERLESKIDTVSEGVLSSHERIARVDTKIDRLAGDIASSIPTTSSPSGR